MDVGRIAAGAAVVALPAAIGFSIATMAGDAPGKVEGPEHLQIAEGVIGGGILGAMLGAGAAKMTGGHPMATMLTFGGLTSGLMAGLAFNHTRQD